MSVLSRSISLLIMAILLLTGVILPGCSNSTPGGYEEAITLARTRIWQDISSGAAGSATVAIMDNGKIVYSEGFGMADRERSIPVDKDTLFNIGSVTKVFDATAVMLLVDDGKVKLDDPVVKYLPDFTMADPRYKDITVRMTLNHTSGLPGTTYAGNFGYEYNAEVFKQTLDNLSRSHLKHAPGAMAVYCNDGFTLAEMIVERVSGRKFVDFLADRAFKPLSLVHTGRSVGERQGEKAALYYEPGTAKKHPLEAVSILGAGGFASTAEDLCRFTDSFSGGGPQILSSLALAEMRKAQPALFTGKLKNPEYAVGLGWDMSDLPQFKASGINLLAKNGGTGNYSSMMVVAPAQRLSVAVIESGPGSSATGTALDMLRAVLANKGLMPKSSVAVSKLPDSQPIPAQYAAFDGYYAPLKKISFDFKTNTVSISQVDRGRVIAGSQLYYHDGDFYDARGNRFYFITIDGQSYYVSTNSGSGTDGIKGQKLILPGKPQSLSLDLNGKQWLMRNSIPFEGVTGNAQHLITSYTIQGLPGYVDFYGVKEVMAPDFAGMPVASWRDQMELTLLQKDGQTWAQLSEMLFSPVDAAVPLNTGVKTVTVGANGYSEWLRAAEDLIVSFTKPAKGRVIVFSSEGQTIFDSSIDNGEVFVPKASFIEFSATRSEKLVVTAR